MFQPVRYQHGLSRTRQIRLPHPAARLKIRHGDGAAAHQLLDTLLTAIRTCDDAIIDGRTLRLAHIAASDEDHRTIHRWLWAVLLADGTRALTSLGRWRQALSHVTHNNGVGHRLLDGRQVAVIAHSLAGDPAEAIALTDRSAPTEPWEHAVAACLRVLCSTLATQPTRSAVTTMISRHLALDLAPELGYFHSRLGLTVIDLAVPVDDSTVGHVATRIVRAALDAEDGYIARDVLAHTRCAPHLKRADRQRLTAVVDSAGIGPGPPRKDLVETLLTTATISETVTKQILQHPAQDCRRARIHR